MGEESQQSIWNFDGEELFLICKLKHSIVEYLEIWDLDNAYRKIRLLRMEIDAKLKRAGKRIVEEHEEEIESQKKKQNKEKKGTEKERVDKLMNEVDESFSEYNEDKNNEELTKKMYSKLESFYMELCYIMKQHGLYFREGEDMSLAVLRR